MTRLTSNEFDKLMKHSPRQFYMKVGEELSELAVAYNHYLDNKAIAKEVHEEIADVYIQIEKILYILSKNDPEINHSHEVHRFFDLKIERLLNVISKAEWI